ncbi:MAG: type II secretion system protein GspM [Burkholderiaceae bacterium]|nr:type II secretion system protein GspM [Burkholderiaceae bacterium]
MSGPIDAVTPAKATADSAALPASWIALRLELAQHWAALAPRERAWLTAAGTVIGMFLAWSLAIQPAWRTTQAAPAQLDRLESQMQTMRQQSAETTELRNAPPVSPAQAGAALQAATARLGSRAQMVLQGDRASVTVKGLSGNDLSNWLTEVRSGARARPTEVQLMREGQGYSGTLVLTLGSGR